MHFESRLKEQQIQKIARMEKFFRWKITPSILPFKSILKQISHLTLAHTSPPQTPTPLQLSSGNGSAGDCHFTQ